MVTLESWRERMSEDMRLHDFRPRTQEAYLLAARLFIERVAREPDTLTDEDVRVYFLVLSQAEVRAVLGVVRHPVRRMALSTIYALGLRLGEGLSLDASDVDGERLMVWLRDAKGAKGAKDRGGTGR